MRRYQDAPELRPHFRRILRPLPQAGQRGFDASFGFRGQLQAVTADKLEKAEQHGWILNRRKLAQKDPALDHGKIGIRQTRFAIFEQPVQTRARRRHFVEEDGEPVNRADMPEISSHPDRGRDRHSVRQSDSCGRSFGLQFVGQSVQVAALAIVQKTSHRRKKIQRRIALLREKRPATGSPARARLPSSPVRKSG